MLDIPELRSLVRRETFNTNWKHFGNVLETLYVSNSFPNHLMDTVYTFLRHFQRSDARKLGRSDVRTPEHPDARTSGRSDARTPGRPDARTLGRPGVRTAGRSDAYLPLFLNFCGPRGEGPSRAAPARAGPRRHEPGGAGSSRAAPALAAAAAKIAKNERTTEERTYGGKH